MTTNCQERAVPIWWWLGATERAWLASKSSVYFSIDLQNPLLRGGFMMAINIYIYIHINTIQNKDNTCIAPLSATLHLYHFYLWARQPAAKWSLWRVYPLDLGDGTVEIMPPKSSRKKLVPLICHPQLTRTFHIIHIAFIYPQLIPTPIYCWFLDRLRAHAALFVSGRGPQSSASQMGACLAVACRKNAN